MYCNACGKSIADDAGFCSYCGAVVGPHCAPKKLVRPGADRRIAGVCAGIGEYFCLDAIVVRLIWVFVTFVSGLVPGIVVYILAWIIVPEESAIQAMVRNAQPATPVATGG